MPPGPPAENGRKTGENTLVWSTTERLVSTFLDDPPGRKEGTVQRQRRVLGVRGVTWPQPVHHRMHGDVGKPECSSCKDVSDAGIHVRVVAAVRRQQLCRCILTQDPRQVVVPRQNLKD